MKKIIIALVVMAMVIVMCGAASPRAVDYSSVIDELEDEGFVRRGDVWTLEEYGEDNLDWVVIWYDMVDNHGVMTIHGYDDDEYSRRVYISGMYTFEWNYDTEEFDIIDITEIRR